MGQLIVCAIIWIWTAGIGMAIADLKNRSLWAGGLLGGFLGLIGITILLFFKTVPDNDMALSDSIRQRQWLDEHGN